MYILLNKENITFLQFSLCLWYPSSEVAKVCVQYLLGQLVTAHAQLLTKAFALLRFVLCALADDGHDDVVVVDEEEKLVLPVVEGGGQSQD